MLVKIINGVYGHYTEGKVVRKDKKSEPFDLEPDKAARLVSQGVAEYVDEVQVAAVAVEEVDIPDLEDMNGQPASRHWEADGNHVQSRDHQGGNGGNAGC